MSNPKSPRVQSAWFVAALLLPGLLLACSTKAPDEPAGRAAGGSTASPKGGSGGTASSGGSTGSGGASAGGGGGSGGTAAGGGTGGGGTATGGTSGSGGGGGSSSGGSGGNADASPPDGAAVETGAAEVPVGTGPMVLTSSVFKAGGPIAAMYRCMHENLSPPLAWTPGPAGTLSYAVTMLHAQSIHWVLWDIPATTTSLPLNVEKVAQPPVPVGSKQAKPNIDGATWFGYTGPCPSSSSHYEYYVYALKVVTLPDVTTASTTGQVQTAIKKNSLASAELSGTAAKNAP